MRKRLLLSTAALVAGVAIASAQNMPGGGQSGGGMSGGGAAQERSQSQSRGGQAQERSGQAQEQGRGGQAQGQREQTTGQREQGQKGAAQKDQGQEKSKQGQAQRDQGMQGQKGAQQQRGQREQTTGQGQREQGQAQQRGQRDQTTGQREQTQSPTQTQRAPQAAPSQGQAQQGRAPQQGQANQQGQAQVEHGQAGSVTLSADQRTRVRERIFAGGNVPRATNVNFAVRVGTVVPRSVRIVEVPEVLIEIHPEWRGHSYFVVNDDVVIVDREYRIVADVPVGPSGAQLENRGGGMSGGAQFNAESVSSEQIREVQIALKQQGFDIEVDGKLGPRTHQALILFQQRNGLQATGRIDQKTFASVTKSTTSGQGNQTTGQGGASAPAGQAPTGQAPAGQAPAGQGSNSMQHPSANQPSDSQHPAQPQAKEGSQSTTGQGGAPANNNMQPANPPAQGGAPKQGSPQR